MANKLFVAGDGNYNTAASWSPVAAVPGAGDNVWLGPDSPAMTVGPTTTNQDVKLGNFTTHPLYKYNVCSSGSPCIISASKILIQHAGSFFFQCHDGGAGNKTDRIVVACPAKNLGQAIELGKAATGPGDIDYIEVLRGNVTLTDATGLDEVHADYMENPSGDVELTINSGVATIPILRAMAGRIHCSTTVTALYADGAYYRQLLNTITNLYGGAGTVEFNTAGTIARARIGGRLNLDLTQTMDVKTITELNTYAESVLKKFEDDTLHIITAWNDYRKAA